MSVQQVTLVLERGNVVHVTRSPESYRPASSRIFDEVNARKRPLGSDV